MCRLLELSPVTSISVDYSCSTSSASVSWDGVFAADSYKAEAVESNGTVLSCTTQGTSCQIAGLGCGQSYVVHVIALSESDGCESTANATATFSTGEIGLNANHSHQILTFNNLMF